MLKLGNQAFSRLFSHASFTHSSAGMLGCLFPLTVTGAQDNVSRGSAQHLHVPYAGFPAIREFPCFPCSFGPAQSSHFWCGDVRSHFGWSGLSFPRSRVQQNPPRQRGAEGAAHSRNIALGVSWREVISQPVFMCSDTTRARLFHLSSFPLSQCRVQCLLASPGCCRPTLPGKNNSTTPCFCKRARAVPWHSHPGSLSLSWS